MSRSFTENQYNRDWVNHQAACPRCAKAVPVTIVKTETGLELHCRMCKKSGHKDGSFIEELDLTKVKRIIDGYKGIPFIPNCLHIRGIKGEN